MTLWSSTSGSSSDSGAVSISANGSSHLPRRQICVDREYPLSTLPDTLRRLVGLIRCSTLGVLLHVSQTKRLRSSSGHGVDWRTGVNFQHPGSFTHNVKFLSCPWISLSFHFGLEMKLIKQFVKLLSVYIHSLMMRGICRVLSVIVTRPWNFCGPPRACHQHWAHRQQSDISRRTIHIQIRRGNRKEISKLTKHN